MRVKNILTTLILIGSCNLVTVFAADTSLDFVIISVPKSSFVINNDETDDLMKTAIELYRQKKYDDALTLCNKAAALSPKDFRPHYLSGWIYLEQGKYKTASESFAKSAELKPAKEVYLLKATADQMRGAKEEAIAACRKVLELDPNSSEAFMMIGDTLRDDEKRRDEAVAAYRSALKGNSDKPFTFLRLSNILLSLKDEKGAEEGFRKALDLDPNKMSGRYEIAGILVKQGKLKEARILWEGRTNDTDNMMPKFITVLERAERVEKAEADLSNKPNDPQVLLEIGNAVMDGDHWVVDGRQERAVVYFRKALSIKPDFAAAQYAICKAFIQIADTYQSKQKNVDEELAKLGQMDAKLAQEMEEYRKTYKGGLRITTVKPKQ